MFHWIELQEQLVCAETGAYFELMPYSDDLVSSVNDDLAIYYNFPNVERGYSIKTYDTEAERDEAWTKLKEQLGVKWNNIMLRNARLIQFG